MFKRRKGGEKEKMQTVKYKKPVPIWIIVIIAIIAIVAVISALGLSGLFGDFFGSVATGLINVFTALFTVPYQWASANIINGITFTVAGIIGIGVIFLMIAKRRYLVSEKMLVAAGTQQPYQPQVGLSSPTLSYDNPVPTAPAQVPEEKKEE